MCLIFCHVLSSAEINKFAPKERSEYIKQMITIRDIVNQMATAEEKGLTKGIEQGIEQGRRDTIRKFMAAGASKELIAAATGLSIEEIEALK